jgi:hypothetical protein
MDILPASVLIHGLMVDFPLAGVSPVDVPTTKIYTFPASFAVTSARLVIVSERRKSRYTTIYSKQENDKYTYEVPHGHHLPNHG